MGICTFILTWLAPTVTWAQPVYRRCQVVGRYLRLRTGVWF